MGRIWSTYGTWSLIIVNSILFFVSQYLYNLRETQRVADVQALLVQSLERKQMNSTENDNRSRESATPPEPQDNSMGGRAKGVQSSDVRDSNPRTQAIGDS